MLSTIVQMPTQIPISYGMMTPENKKKKSLEAHHRRRCCYTNINAHEKPAAFQCLFSRHRPVISSSLSSCGAMPTQDSAAANDTDKEDEAEGLLVLELPGGLRPELMPEHVAIIMDGHGRWAEQRGLRTEQGHHAGHENLKKLILSACAKFQLKVLTVNAFSTENWKRSQLEIDFLMSGYEDVIRSYVMELILRHDLRFSVIGDKSRLPPSLQSTISVAEESSKTNNGMHFVMAMSYSGRLDITEAVRTIASKAEGGILQAEDVNDEILHKHLMTSLIQVPDPDLLIRTSGEMRVSNFLLWQMAYAEFYFASKMFPDLDEADLVEALTYFQARKKHYGGR